MNTFVPVRRAPAIGVALVVIGAVLAPRARATGPFSPAAPTSQRIAFVRFTTTDPHPRIYTVSPNRRSVRPVRLPVVAAERPAWSPDGRRFAFIGGLNSPEENHVTAGDDLYIAGAGGSGVRRLTHDTAHEAGPAWSPDGKLIAFVRSSDANPNRSWIAVIAPDGRHLRALTRGNIDLEPAWMPGGQGIVFLRISSRTHEGEIWRVRPDGSGIQRILSQFQGMTDPVPSPDGTRMLLTSSRVLMTIRLDGSGRRILSRLSTDSKGAREDPEPAWSPDGKSIVFCQLRSGSLQRSDLWIVGANGKSLRRLMRSPGLDTNPSWHI